MKEPSSTVTDSTTAFSYVVVASLTLVSFLMAQSIYEFISANLEFLTLRHHATQVQLLLMIFAFQFIPALFLSTVWLIFKKLNSTLAKWFFNGVAFILFLIFFLQVHNKLFSSHRLFAHSSVLALVPAVLLALLCASHPNAFRSFVLFLSPFVLIFPALFLFHTWQTVSAANQKGVPAVSSTSDNTGMERQRHPPVFMLILDELTRSALLDKNGEIDGDRYPNFKNLAASSTFFRNATANADRTVRSLPVILTGNFPIGNDPSLSAYPDNLLSLLRPYYRIHVRELTTRFCREPDFDCPDGKYLSSSSELLKDTLLFYASGVVPTFLDSYLEALEVAAHRDRFDRFVSALTLHPGDNDFYFVHQWLPHSPYMLDPQGKIHAGGPPAVFGHSHARDPGTLAWVRSRYLMQIGYADKQLGAFIGKLKDSGVYDSALVIVTADHGVSWRVDSPGRDLSNRNAELIMSVPLFIKIPGQRIFAVSDSDVQHIDLLPTVTDVLGVQIPWKHVGRSILDRDPASRKKVIYDANGKRFEFSDHFGMSGQTQETQ